MKHTLLKLLCILGAWFLGMLGLPAGAYAATPVDIYQDMNNRKAGELLAPSIMNASSHGGRSAWTNHGTMWISTNHGRKLPGPVVVGKTTFPGSADRHSWVFNDETANNYVSCTMTGSYAKITVGCYYTPGVTIPFGNQFDTIIMSGNKGYSVLQTRNDDRKGPYLRAHSCTTGWVTTFSPTQIKITPGKTYWVNLHFDGTLGKTYVAAFDPDNGFDQVGDTVIAESTPNSTMARRIQFGRGDNHGNNPTAKTQSYLSQILVDYSHGTFPLIPGRQ